MKHVELFESLFSINRARKTPITYDEVKELYNIGAVDLAYLLKAAYYDKKFALVNSRRIKEHNQLVGYEFTVKFSDRMETFRVMDPGLFDSPGKITAVLHKKLREFGAELAFDYEFEEYVYRTDTGEYVYNADEDGFDWPLVVNRAFANDDLAVIYWTSCSRTGYFQPTAVFAHDRTVPGTAIYIHYGGKNMENDAASEAYEAGAKMVINSASINIVRYDNGNKSIKVESDSIRGILSITKRSFERIR